jgi:hypothetical protein
MENELKQEVVNTIIPILDQTREGLAKAVDVLQEQFPLLVEEILTWNCIKSGTCCFLFMMLMFLTSILSVWMWKIAKKEYDKDAADNKDTSWIVLPCLIQAVLITPMAGVIYHHTWLQIWIAPRLFLLEYIGDLLK